MNFNLYLVKYIKTKSKWTICLNTKHKFMNLQETIFWCFIRQTLFSIKPIVWCLKSKEKTDQLAVIKSKKKNSLCNSNVKIIKEQTHRKHVPCIYLIKDFYSEYGNNSDISNKKISNFLSKKKKKTKLKMGKIFEHFTKEDK